MAYCKLSNKYDDFGMAESPAVKRDIWISMWKRNKECRWCKKKNMECFIDILHHISAESLSSYVNKRQVHGGSLFCFHSNAIKGN